MLSEAGHVKRAGGHAEGTRGHGGGGRVVVTRGGEKVVEAGGVERTGSGDLCGSVRRGGPA
ncbi:hypothetical protein ACFU5P_31460, partial [Streptomyces sp. NPDC057433]|uniref:hypothetical protein n=1 Tax=Streptomyces sp. NPDC057433 TaxID=3346132 RepID=UPI0036BCED24